MVYILEFCRGLDRVVVLLGLELMHRDDRQGLGLLGIELQRRLCGAVGSGTMRSAGVVRGDGDLGLCVGLSLLVAGLLGLGQFSPGLSKIGRRGAGIAPLVDLLPRPDDEILVELLLGSLEYLREDFLLRHSVSETL